MEKWLLVAETSCNDPSREKEFNEWYNNVHIPDVLETPGILRATRYETSDPGDGQGKYLALYDVETEDIAKTLAVFGEVMTKKWEQGRMLDVLVAHSAIFYRQITAPVESK
ncbi:MAG: DUF4286 family protein [Dehalococcoidia bacterium]